MTQGFMKRLVQFEMDLEPDLSILKESGLGSFYELADKYDDESKLIDTIKYWSWYLKDHPDNW